MQSVYLTKEDLEGYGDLKKGGEKVVCTVKYANDSVLSTKEETVSATGYDRLSDIGKTCGMEMRFSRHPPPSADYNRSKPTGKCRIFQLLL
jgi:hypothetical protein